METQVQVAQEYSAGQALFSSEAKGITYSDPSYILYGTEWSGMIELSEALESTGLAGHPGDYFTPFHALNYAEEWGLLLCDEQGNFSTAYLHQVYAVGTTPNSIFAAKSVLSDVSYPIYWKLVNLFARSQHIIVMRRDKVRQAISWWKALETVQWSKRKENRKDGEEHRLVFDFETIEELWQTIINNERRMLELFALVNIQPYIVVYEDFIRTYKETLLQILAHLHILVPHQDLTLHPQSVQAHSDEQMEMWIRQYREIKQQQSTLYYSQAL